MITSKAQTAVPQAVRTTLRLKEGDEIADGKVVITKAAVPRMDDPFATFDEWDSATIERRHADRLDTLPAAVLADVLAILRRQFGFG